MSRSFDHRLEYCQPTGRTVKQALHLAQGLLDEQRVLAWMMKATIIIDMAMVLLVVLLVLVADVGDS